MEAVIEKECSALGGLFQSVIGDIKVSTTYILHLMRVWLRGYIMRAGGNESLQVGMSGHLTFYLWLQTKV